MGHVQATVLRVTRLGGIAFYARKGKVEYTGPVFFFKRAFAEQHSKGRQTICVSRKIHSEYAHHEPTWNQALRNFRMNRAERTLGAILLFRRRPDKY
jgi:hypothetical protein